MKTCSSFSTAILPMLSQHSSIKGLPFRNLVPSLLVGCLQLHLVLQGIKRHQGSNKCQHQPIIIELMHIFSQSLNFSDYNHTMLWAACCLGFLGVLCTGEFTNNSHFNPNIHIAVSALRWTPFTKVAISTLVLRNVISAPCAPLPSIYIPWLNFWT